MLIKNIDTLFINEAKQFVSNIKTNIYRDIDKNVYDVLAKNQRLRNHLEDTISLINTNAYKYVYVLYRDKKGDYRYLIDGSASDKGEFRERLNVDKTLWDKVFFKQKDLVFSQKNLNTLWITYLSPLVFDGKTEAIVAIDFSTTLPKDIKEAIIPLNNIFTYIFISIIIILLVMLYQTILNFKIKKDSITDTLTKAYNRNFLRDFLKKVNIYDYQILMLDIDYFKKINDNYGHKIGDNILKDIASLIREKIRPEDKFIRYGGEEFIVFIRKSSKNKFLARKIANRIRMAVAKNVFSYGNININITVSIGLTCNPERFRSISEALKYADEMLYMAKKNGRNQIVYEEQDTTFLNKTKKQLHINDIKEAIEEKNVICHYQPIYDSKTNKISKYEALVRLKDKNGDIIYPDKFLSIIMFTNMYNEMTKTVLNIVFEKIKKYNIQISVNLNFSDIANKDIFNMIIEEIDKNKEFASYLTIELLEYEKLEASKLFLENYSKLKSYNVKTAIDDFGSGFANYDIFKLLDIDLVKIDGSLIKNINDSKTLKNIVESIVYLTDKLEIETVAEFVFSKEVYETIKDLNITYSQGFYLSKPKEDIDDI
jgi:diguanylate cyclase (GGDEF)-like protein